MKNDPEKPAEENSIRITEAALAAKAEWEKLETYMAEPNMSEESAAALAAFLEKLSSQK